MPEANRRPGVARIWILCAALSLLFAGAAAAQQIVPGSELAGVIFPVPSNLWVPDAQRSQAAALDDAAALTNRACGPTEFLIWDALGENRDAIRLQTDTAFAEAGWSLAVINIDADGNRVYLATRGTDELVMAWLPKPETIGLVLCVVSGPRTANAGVGAIANPAQELMPVPRPRPDPNAPVEIAAAEPEPAASEAPAASDVAAASPGVIAGDESAGGDAIGNVITAEADTSPPSAIAEGDTEEEPGGSSVSIGLLALAVGLGIAAAFLVRWGRAGARAAAGAGWPTTLATVVYSDVASEARQNQRGVNVTRYVPVIAYEYLVDGVAYQAARLRFGDASKAKLDEARKIVDRFPLGAGIEIRYDPKNPQDATIEADPDRLELRLIGGIALAVLAVAALINAVG
jgi:hypothetical protein